MARTAIVPEDFVVAWELSESVAEVARRLSASEDREVEVDEVMELESELRSLGVRLKKLTS